MVIIVRNLFGDNWSLGLVSEEIFPKKFQFFLTTGSSIFKIFNLILI